VTVPRRLVSILLVVAAVVGAWAGTQAYAFFAGA
jgi:hypothetical protein